MASSAPPSDATNSPVLSLINQRLCALRKKRKRIRHMEESIAPRKRIKTPQQNLRRSKISVAATIVELKKLRRQLSFTLREELPLAAQRLPSDNGGDADNNDGTAGGASSTHSAAGVPEMATSSGPANDAAANDETAGGTSSTHTSGGVPEMATSSGPAKDAAGNDGTAGGASFTHTSTESQRMDTHVYEVFLSFRGPDARSGLVDFLYTRLKGVGIHTFKDDERICVGEKFEPKLVEAISQSAISIPIFTKGYASSVWCLMELAHMVKFGSKIMPIFYDVAPAVVRHQKGDYAGPFLSHEKKYGKGTTDQWRAALKAVADLSGWDLHNQTDSTRKEGEFAERVTREVFSELKKPYLGLPDRLVSVDNHVDAIMEKIGAGTSATQIIGVHGMGGSGKTTVAKMIYNELSNNFEHCCFLSNIREKSERKGIEFLQDQLIFAISKTKLPTVKSIGDGISTIKMQLRTKKVLLLLDDLDDKKHMDASAVEHKWFCPGSKLIITTRNKKALEVLVKDEDIYEVDGMNDVQSLELFSRHAFNSVSPFPEFIHQSEMAVKIANGLPLALEVIGSLFGHIAKEMWDDTLKMLRSVPRDEVQSKLRISYDALDFRQKRIFLDIACLFIGYDKDILVHFWDESIFFPKETMGVLRSKSMININEDNKVSMHDQLRDLGREIVREESDMKIEKQSKVWDTKEGLNLLRRHKGKKEVEALCLKLDHQCCFTYEGFENLLHLRFLEVDDRWGYFHVEGRLLWRKPGSDVPPTHENSDLLPQLRWLSWRNIPPTFNLTNFSMEDVVFLDLSNSKITDGWEGWSHMKVMKNLKILDLNHCKCLKRTPNFSAHSNLERLILRGCESLIELDKSICQLKCLVFLDLSSCNLRRLPDELGRDLASLEYLSLEHCTSLVGLPDTFGNLESLIELNISFTEFEKLPGSIGKLESLKVVNMTGCKIRKIPNDFWMIKKLEKIEVSGSFSSGNISRDTSHEHNLQGNIDSCIYENKSLRILELRLMEIHVVPRLLPECLIKLKLGYLFMDAFPDLSNLGNLKELTLLFHPRDTDGVVEYLMPQWIGNLSKLESLFLRCDFVTTSPADLSLPPQLKSLHLYCRNLGCLPTLPSSLSLLSLGRCNSLHSMEDISNFKKLSCLQISDAAITKIQGLGCLENLQNLELTSLQQVEILPDLSTLNDLRWLRVSGCRNLVEIQGELPQSLEKLWISSCGSLLKLPDPSSLKEPQKVDIAHCQKLKGDAILDSAQRSQVNFWENLQDLQIRGLGKVKRLPDLSNSNKLTNLGVSFCDNLVAIEGKLPQSLELLTIDSCPSLQKLPDLSSLKELRHADIQHCWRLKGEAFLSQVNFWEKLKYLLICGLGQVEILPDLSTLNDLRWLQVCNCYNLVEIQGQLPQSLKKLEIDSCGSLRKLPYLSSSMALRVVSIRGCDDLVEIQGDLPQSLKVLRISVCESLRELPNLSSSMALRLVSIRKCDDLAEIRGDLPQSLKVLRISVCKSLQELPNLSCLKRLRKVEINGCRNLNLEAISLLLLEKSVKVVGKDVNWEREDGESESEGEDVKWRRGDGGSESEHEGEDLSKFESEGEDDKSEYESEGEDEE